MYPFFTPPFPRCAKEKSNYFPFRIFVYVFSRILLYFFGSKFYSICTWVEGRGPLWNIFVLVCALFFFPPPCWHFRRHKNIIFLPNNGLSLLYVLFSSSTYTHLYSLASSICICIGKRGKNWWKTAKIYLYTFLCAEGNSSDMLTFVDKCFLYVTFPICDTPPHPLRNIRLVVLLAAKWRRKVFSVNNMLIVAI